MPAPCFRRAAFTAAVVLAACSGPHAPSASPPPRAEFLISSADSTFWVATTSGETRVRGASLVLAKYDGRFYEVYATDDDFSYSDALLLGERVYRRDLMSGDSVLVFSDTTVPRFATAYARAHPDERPLGRNEDGEANPATSVTAQLDIIDVFGPYLSYEYHVDVDLPGRTPWHATRQGVIDLRTGKTSHVGDLFGSATGARLTADARRAYQGMRDSMLRARPQMSEPDRRAIDALQRLQFDETSFTLSEDGGRPEVTFGIPGHGAGPAGHIVELEPLAADSAGWWSALANGFATSDDAGNDRWTGAGYQVLARYDTSGEIARLTLADSAHREWPLSAVRAPLLQVAWLDRPPLHDDERRALQRAFNQAAKYDENARVADNAVTPAYSRWASVGLPAANRHANVQDRQRKPTRNIRAHDARACQQHGACLRRRHSLDDGQNRGDLRVSAQPRQRRDGIDRPRRFSRADSPWRSGDHAGECQLRGAKLDGGRGARRGRRPDDRAAAAHQLLLSDVRCR